MPPELWSQGSKPFDGECIEAWGVVSVANPIINSLFLLDFSVQGIKGIDVMMIALGIGIAIGMMLLGVVLFAYLLKG